MSKILGCVRDALLSLSSVSEEVKLIYSPRTLGFFICIILLYKICNLIKYNKCLPPGPRGYPVLGMIPKIKKEFHLQLFDYTKDFGKIFSLKMGNQLMVVLSDHKLIKAAFGKSDFAAKPQMEFLNFLDGRGIINAEGKLWKNQRRFLHQQKFGMKHWGVGSEQLEARVSQEVHYFLNSIRQEEKNPINPAPMLNCAVSNVICSMIMSTRFKHNDEKFKRFMHLFHEGFRLFNLTGYMIFFPVLKHLPGTNDTLKALEDNMEEMMEFVQFIIKEHKTTLDTENPRDLVDSYLIEIENAKESGNFDVFDSIDPERQLEQVILDIFSAGVETIKTTLQWAILFMIHQPEVRKKVQEELASVVSPDRLPSMDDMPNLPYTRATIYEVMRRSTVVPLGTTHRTIRTVEFEGHIIPKNTHVIPLLHGVHMDPEVWEQPDTFKPERFLTEDGRLHKPAHFMPFGAGQRMCLGDKIAEMELQLFFSSLLHVFDIENPGAGLPSLRGLAGVTVSPQDFEVNFIPRNISALAATDKHKVQAWTQHVKLFKSSKSCLSI